MRYFCFFLFILLIATASFSQDWRYIHPYRGVNIYATLGFAYDGNVFRYADSDIDKFINNIEPYRYPIETYDDMVTSIEMHAKLRSKLIMNRSTTFNLKIKGNLYYQNNVKDYATISASMWHRIGSSGHLLLRYLFLPRYFIRYYPDFDVVTPYGYPYFAGCYFVKHLAGISAGSRLFGITEVEISYSRELNDYNDAFNEYDTHMDQFGISAGLTYRDFIYPTLSYRFTMADAKAFDETGETKQMSDDSDISHTEDEIRLSLDLDFTRHKPFRIETDLTYVRRLYTTEKPVLVDPTHAGREDTNLGFLVTCLFIPTERITFSLGYEFEHRSVSSPYDINQIEDIKNYARSIYSAQVSFSY
jgi:hypothetical protein